MPGASDPHFASIDNEIISVFFRSCAESKGIRTRATFREAEGTDLEALKTINRKEMTNPV